MLRSLGRNGVADRCVPPFRRRKQLIAYPFLFTGVSSPGIIMPRLSELVVAGLLHSHHQSVSFVCTGGPSTSTLAFCPRVFSPHLPPLPQSPPKMNPARTRSHLRLIKPKLN